MLKAIDIARQQAVKSLELRAATSLARLWSQRGKRRDAEKRLGDVYAWFTEGFVHPRLLKYWGVQLAPPSVVRRITP